MKETSATAHSAVNKNPSPRRQESVRYHFNEYDGIVVLYWRGKWHSVGEKRVHSPKETLTSLTTAHVPKVIFKDEKNG